MLEYLVGVIAGPVQALRQVAEKKLWKQGLLLVAVLALLNAAVSLATPSTASPGISILGYIKLPAKIYTPAFFIPFFVGTSTLWWLLSGAVYYFLSKLFKGTGTLAGMLAGLGFATSPYLLSIPVSALALLFGHTTASLVGRAAGLVAWIWILVLNVLAIRESQQLGTGQAIGVILLTVEALCLLLLIITLIYLLVGIVVIIRADLG